MGENREVNTLRLTIDAERLESAEASAALDRAAKILRGGGAAGAAGTESR